LIFNQAKNHLIPTFATTCCLLQSSPCFSENRAMPFFFHAMSFFYHRDSVRSSCISPAPPAGAPCQAAAAAEVSLPTRYHERCSARVANLRGRGRRRQLWST